MDDPKLVTIAERQDLREQALTVFRSSWPEFIFHDPIDSKYAGYVQARFSQYDMLLIDNGDIVARGWGVPLCWDGKIRTLPKGYDGALISAVQSREASIRVDTLCIMGATVKAERQRAGLAIKLLVALCRKAINEGLRRVIAPVRPALKSRYPLTPMKSFAHWMRGDGLHIDPWIRTHQRLGARILMPASPSMTIKGTVSEWEDWTKILFPKTGQYVIPGALDLVAIDLERDCGIYNETNLWMRHL
jgi:hypothetical protein